MNLSGHFSQPENQKPYFLRKLQKQQSLTHITCQPIWGKIKKLKKYSLLKKKNHQQNNLFRRKLNLVEGIFIKNDVEA